MKPRPGLSAVGVDIDGVLVDTIRHSARFLSQRVGRTIEARDIIHNWTGIADIDRHFAENGLELLGSLPPYPGVVETLAWLGGHCTVHLVSARAEYSRVVTEAWLAASGIHPDALLLTAGASKLPLCRERGIALFVEDSPLNARELAEGGVSVLLLDTEYNGDCTHPLVRRCHGWPEIRAALGERLGLAG